jgi:hypothetical protein
MRSIWRSWFLALGAVALIASCQRREDTQAAMQEEGSQGEMQAAEGTESPPTPPPGSPEAKVALAVSAAPASIGRGAAVVELTGDGGINTIREGTNGWTCIVDDPTSPAADPICLDGNSMIWARAWMSHTSPKLAAPGIGYMLQGGQSPSNTDPFATQPPAGQGWLDAPPHLMIFPAGKLDETAYSTDPKAGGPWVMYPGTPYAHLMIPVE